MIYKTNLNENGFYSYLKKINALLILYIETASLVDYCENWDFYLLFRKNVILLYYIILFLIYDKFSFFLKNEFKHYKKSNYIFLKTINSQLNEII